MGERSATSEPLNRCYTMRGRSPRVQQHEDFHRKSEALGGRATLFELVMDKTRIILKMIISLDK